MDGEVVDLVHRLLGALVALADETTVLPRLPVAIAEDITLRPGAAHKSPRYTSRQCA